MTDAEIIKAWELVDKLREAYNAYYDTSTGMPYDIDVTLRESAFLVESLLNENKSQKAEKERLKQERDKEHDNCNHYARMCVKAKSEARKEFAERLKEKAVKTYYGELVFTEDDIDNLLKEMG